MSNGFLGEAIEHAEYFQNRITRRASKIKTPFEHLFGRTPNNFSLKVFGCRAYVRKHKETCTSQLDDHASKGICLGVNNRCH